MKTLTIALIVSLLAPAAWSKGGDNPWIPGDQFQDQIKAYQQVKVTFGLTNNLNAYQNSIKDFVEFLGYVDGSISSHYSLKNSVHSAEFCVTLQSAKIKPAGVGEINKELSFYPSHLMNLSVDSNLKAPCD